MTLPADGTSRQGLAFRTGDPKLVQIWDALQRYQTDFCIAQELPLYYTSPRWRRAAHVVDVGTGNGYYLDRIVDLFPEKRYLGIDSDVELLSIAQGQVRRDQVAFQLMDFGDLAGEHDFVILRLVLQHIGNVDAVLGRLAEQAVPGAGAILVEAHDPQRFFDPPLPAFMAFFEAFRSQEKLAGPDKSITSTLRDLVSRHPAWRIERATTLTVPSTIPGNMELFRKTYGLVIDLAEALGQIRCDFEPVRKEWHRWCALERAYAQVGLQVIQLART